MKNGRNRLAAARGVTLIEIMIVLAIIGLIMGVLVGPKVMSAFKEARIKTTWQWLVDIGGQYPRWQADNEGDCPEKIEDILKYVNKRDPKDPWGTPIVMKCGEGVPSDSHFGVVSFGPDKKEGTDDDIHSWDVKPKI